MCDTARQKKMKGYFWWPFLIETILRDNVFHSPGDSLDPSVQHLWLGLKRLSINAWEYVCGFIKAFHWSHMINFSNKRFVDCLTSPRSLALEPESHALAPPPPSPTVPRTRHTCGLWGTLSRHHQPPSLLSTRYVVLVFFLPFFSSETAGVLLMQTPGPSTLTILPRCQLSKTASQVTRSKLFSFLSTPPLPPCLIHRG